MNRMPASSHLDSVSKHKCIARRIQCNKEVVCRTNEWLSWVVRRGSVWRSPSRRHHRVPRLLSPQATRDEFIKPSNCVAKDAQGQTLDLSDEQAVECLFMKLGAFDHLVFTAGDGLHLQDLATADLQQARRAFELRYWSALAAV